MIQIISLPAAKISNDKADHSLVISGAIHQEDTKILNVNESNIISIKHGKQILTKLI